MRQFRSACFWDHDRTQPASSVPSPRSPHDPHHSRHPRCRRDQFDSKLRILSLRIAITKARSRRFWFDPAFFQLPRCFNPGFDAPQDPGSPQMRATRVLATNYAKGTNKGVVFLWRLFACFAGQISFNCPGVLTRGPILPRSPEPTDAGDRLPCGASG